MAEAAEGLEIETCHAMALLSTLSCFDLCYSQETPSISAHSAHFNSEALNVLRTVC